MSANNTPRTPPAVPVGQKEAKRAPGGAMLNRGGSFIDNFRTKKSVSEKSKLEEEEKKWVLSIRRIEFFLSMAIYLN